MRLGRCGTVRDYCARDMSLQASVPTIVLTLANLNRAECRLLLETLARMFRPRICCRSLASVCRSMRICVFPLDTLTVAAVTLVTRLWGWDPKVRFTAASVALERPISTATCFQGKVSSTANRFGRRGLPKRVFRIPHRILIMTRPAPRACARAAPRRPAGRAPAAGASIVPDDRPRRRRRAAR